MTPLHIRTRQSADLGGAAGEPGRPGAARFGVAGSAGTRLLGGPPRSAGTEGLADHERRLGPLSLDHVPPAALRDAVRESRLLGRGGGQFPTATKLDVAAQAPGTPIVVVNASEGEPASRKDRTLLELRPHLVLDGAEVAAAATGADEIIVYLHRRRLRSTSALEEALRERHRAGRPVRLVDAPERYVAGETSAVVSYLGGTGALPRRDALPAAAAGVAGRPTVVGNAETIAHLALVARFGAAWFATAGSPEAPGSTLVTLAGAVAVPGVVVEVLGGVTIGDLLATVGGLDVPPRAVLLGGYAGTWIDGDVAWRTPLERHALGVAGASLGCGLIAVLGGGACGLAETARLLRWMAGQSAGQCGPCAIGLPSLSVLADEVVGGLASRRDVRRLRQLAASIRGRGACGHPTGAVNLLESAIATFERELAQHLRGRACPEGRGPGTFPLPAEEGPRP
ncbi:MAG TPA: NADH-ubiquinone oxidoreductase-F iron-sulfur binding region domain-containing protein [Acidimicrobiales bacterium]|nr:NADH-ubiquinone oxidoreductase-F iron-sulfur binding region domain-containing protein [Acidimicrobiales bacterium]